MNVDPQDIAKLDDNTVKLLVVGISESFDRSSPTGAFMLSLRDAMIRALRGRHRSIQLLELDLLNDPDEIGHLVGPDDDPVANALRELRGEAP